MELFSEKLRVALVQVVGARRCQGLLAMSAGVGLMVMHEMMNAEMTAKVGAAKHAKVADRQANWHGDRCRARSCWAPDATRSSGRGVARPTDVKIRARHPRPSSPTTTCSRSW